MPPAAINSALPPVLLLANWVLAPPLVRMVALPAVLLSVNEIRLPPPLLMMLALPAELVSTNVNAPLLMMVAFAAVLALLNWMKALLVKLGTDAELLTIPAPLTVKNPKFVNE
jgi:hypothetical protein